MNSFELFNENQQPCGVWCCGKCRKLVLNAYWHEPNQKRSTREAAELCCTVPKCTACGAVMEPHYGASECNKCQSERYALERRRVLTGRLSMATDVTGEYEGPVYVEDSGGGDMGEGYYSSVETLLDRDDELDEDDDREVLWVFACKAEHRLLNVNDILERVSDDGYEDMYDNLQVPQSLKTAVEEFNTLNAAALTLWHTDYTRKIRVALE